MTAEECNKIIAEYMDRELIKKGSYWFLINQFESSVLDKVYTESLDALVPVWEKMGWKACVVELGVFHRVPWARCESSDDSITSIQDGETIQEAAAIATAKAIKELSK